MEQFESMTREELEAELGAARLRIAALEKLVESSPTQKLQSHHDRVAEIMAKRTVELLDANKTLRREVEERRRAQEVREKVIGDLERALARVKALSGLLPICAACKRIRDDAGYWQQVEVYITDHSNAEFSHGLCPECGKKCLEEAELGSRSDA